MFFLFRHKPKLRVHALFVNYSCTKDERNIMKKFLFLLILFTSACGQPPTVVTPTSMPTAETLTAPHVLTLTPEPTSIPTATMEVNLCDHPFLSLRIGSWWEYRETDLIGGSTVVINPTPYYEVIDLMPNRRPGFTYGSFSLGPGFWCSADGEVNLGLYSAITYLPTADKLIPGTSWTHIVERDDGTNQWTETWLFNAESQEQSITVPGGTFQTICIEWTVSYDKIPSGGTEYPNGRSCFARNVGLVFETHTYIWRTVPDAGVGTYTKELLRYYVP